LKDTARAEELARRALVSLPNHPRISRQLAVAHMLAGRYDAALELLDRRLTADATDVESQWLALHALFATFVAGSGPGATTEGRARLGDLASQYVAANAPHAALARDWAAAVR
jgi:hypothetical protein